jgi:hypothetical protein
MIKANKSPVIKIERPISARGLVKKKSEALPIVTPIKNEKKVPVRPRSNYGQAKVAVPVKSPLPIKSLVPEKSPVPVR